MRRTLLPSSAGLALLAFAATGCGGGGPSSTGAETATHPGTTATQTSSAKNQKQTSAPNASPHSSKRSEPRSEPGPPASAFTPKPHQDSGGGADQFIVKGADNSVQEFGAEADESELEEAASALHAFLDARAERNWAAACTYLSAETKRGFAELAASSDSQAPPQTCAASLAALSGKVPTATLREAAVADVGSLRREGERGFLIYRGAPTGTVYAISLALEDGAWKLASLAGTPLN